MDNNKSKSFFNSNIWILLLTVVFAYIFSIYYQMWPLSSTSEGDFGRDLYDFYLVSKGQLPYVDFNWIYGPLVPLLYGLMFKIFGVSVLNAVSLWFLIYFIAIVLMFYLVKSFSNAFIGFLAGSTLLISYGIIAQTFNHITGVCFIILALMFTKKYLDTSQPKFLYLCSLSTFFLAITKLNIGIAFAVPLFFFILLYSYLNKKPLLHIIGSIAMLIGLTFIVYGSLIYLSPIDQLHKSFPYSQKSIMLPVTNFASSLFEADAALITYEIAKHKYFNLFYFIYSLNLWYFIIMFLGLIFAYYIYKKETLSSPNLFYILILSFCAIACTHEFIIAGTAYSLRFWPLISLIVLVSFIAQYLLDNWNTKKYFKPIFITFCVLLFIGLSGKLYIASLYQRYYNHYCPYQRVKVGFINFPWFITMFKASEYIKANTLPDEKLFSLPYNMFYNFVTEREQPSRYCEFLYITGLTDKDQQKVIEDIEQNKVKLILYSRKVGGKILGMGNFGQTHCIILDKYIKENYNLDISFYFKDLNYEVAPISFYKRKTPFK